MKKKFLSLTVAIGLLATAAIGGTLAYFTDTDAETNVFTVGNIDIDLKENFDSKNAELMPGKENAVNKDAWITNTGTNDAWVWAEVLIPAALDDGDDNSPQAPGLGNSLHVNYLGANALEYAQNTDANGKYYNENLNALWIMQHNNETDKVSYGYMGTETIGEGEDAVIYNKFIKFYTAPLEPGNSTIPFIDQAYMDAEVTQGDNCYILADGKTKYTGTWDIIVRAYGMQTDGFENTIDESTGKITEYGVVKAWRAYDGEEPAEKEVDTTVPTA